MNKLISLFIIPTFFLLTDCASEQAKSDQVNNPPVASGCDPKKIAEEELQKAKAAYKRIGEEKLEQLIQASQNNVMVYGTKTCGWTKKQIAELKKNGIPHTFVDVNANRQNNDEGSALCYKLTKKVSGDILHLSLRE